MNSRVASGSDEPDHPVCPVTGWTVVRRPEWTEVQLDDNYWTTVEVIGGHILRSSPGGYATGGGVANLNALHRQAIAEAVRPGAAHVHIADYTDFKGATLEARRGFAADLKCRDGLAALIVHNTPPFFKLSIKLGKRLLGLTIPVEITSDYASAARLALEILTDAGVEDVPATSITSSATLSPESETGGLEIDSLGLQYETIDGHILHGVLTGYLGLNEMERAIEFESLALSSMNPSKGPLVIIANMSGVKGMSAAARRLYVATLRNRQRTRPISLYVCYGVSGTLRNAINISRPFLPYRLRITRDRETAVEIARRESGAFKPGPIHSPARCFRKGQKGRDSAVFTERR